MDQIAGDAARAALARPLEEAEGLPGYYYGAEFYQAEQRLLFPRGWAPIAVGTQIPNAGDILPIDLAGWPLIRRCTAFRCASWMRSASIAPPPAWLGRSDSRDFRALPASRNGCDGAAWLHAPDVPRFAAHRQRSLTAA
jgi:hypothetical protein